MGLGVAHVEPPADDETEDRMSRLAVLKLTLTDFRSYARAEIRPGEGPVVLTGKNGAGKTNILEALSFLTPGRGLRGGRLADAARIGGGGGWAVAATLQGPDGVVSLGTGITGAEDAGGERRIVRVDGETRGSTAALGQYMRMVWLTPQMDGLFLEGSSARRRFFDRLTAAFHTGHGSQLNAYERAMRERNRLLQEGRADAYWLDALEAQMAAHGTALAAVRLDTLRQLKAALDLAEGAFPRADLALKGLLEEALLTQPAVEVEDAFKARLKLLRGADAQAGRATVGPHRSDLEAVHMAKEMPAALCSTGEQKALLLGITLGSARMIAAQIGSAPVILLDEVAAHLDSDRRAALFDEICALGAQAWLSGAERAFFAGLEGRAMFFSVAQGKVS